MCVLGSIFGLILCFTSFGIMSSDGDDFDLTPLEAQDVLYELLIDLKLRSKLTAQDCCILAFWAVMSGCKAENIKKLAKAPGDPHTGHYSQKFDRVCGLDLRDPDFAYLDLPVYSRAEGARVIRPVACLPPQLTLDSEIKSLDNFEADLRDYVKDLPPVYHDHTVVKKYSPNIAVPLAFYLDGLHYTQRGSMVGFWVVNMATEKRHLMCNIRKAMLCKCGCGGWCTLWPIFHFLDWCFKALARGQHHNLRWDGTAFGDMEPNLGGAAGKVCPTAACVFLKADLAEYSNTLGFWSTSSNRFPCFLCNVTKFNFVILEGWDVLGASFRQKSWGDYCADCQACEVWVQIGSKAQHTELRASMLFDGRRGRGLALRADFPALGLVKGDRLEPHEGAQDIEAFEKLNTFPAFVLFWRSSNEQMAYHRHPLFNETTSTSPSGSCALDWLHTLSSGVFQFWIAIAMLHMFDVDFWKTSQTTIELLRNQSCMAISRDFAAWVRGENKKGRKLTEIGQVEWKMFGAPTKPECLLKAGESNAFMDVYFGLKDRWAELGDIGKPMCDAGVHLFGLLELIRTNPKRMAAASIQRFHFHAKGI